MTNNRTSMDTSRTIIQQENQENNNTKGNYYYNNNYTRSRACSGGDELPGAEVMEMIAREYKENISERITGVAAGIIEAALKKGMEPGTVILAIRETGMASRPSPYYMAAVLRRWAETGVVVSRAMGGFDVSTTQATKWWR